MEPSCAPLLLATAAVANGTERYHWKAVTEGQVKIDDKIPLTWNIYQPDKKKDANLVLVLLGHRWLMLDIKAKLVYQVAPGDLQAQGKDYESDDLAKSEAHDPEQQLDRSRRGTRGRHPHHAWRLRPRSRSGVAAPDGFAARCTIRLLRF